MATKKITKISRNTAQKDDTEFSREIAKNANENLDRPESKNSDLTERPANFDVYPGE